MNVQTEKLEHNMAKLTVTVPAEVFAAATVKAYNKNKGKMSIPGFRKGKTPKAVIERMYGKGVFYEEAADIVLNDTWPEVLKECGLEITSRPEIDILTIEEGKDFVYTALAAVKPEVTLGAYKGVTVERAETSVSELEVNARLYRVREKNSRIVDIQDDTRKIKEDDIVTIDFEGFVDGKPFEGGKGSDYSLVIGSHSFIDTFEDQLKGYRIGEEAEVRVTFPEDYQAEELAGREALFKVLIREIKERQIPELDDEFASEVSEFETLQEYKASLRREIEAEKEKAAVQQNENNVVRAVVDAAEADIPEAMVSSTADNMLREYGEHLKNQGITLDQYCEYTEQTKEELYERTREEARRNIMTNLVLEAVAEKENIAVPEDRLDEQIGKMAEKYKMEPDAIRGILGEARLADMRADLRCQAAVDWLVAEANLVAPQKAAEEEKEDQENQEAEEQPAAAEAGKED